MLLMRPMRQVAKDLAPSPVDGSCRFDSSVQSLAGLGRGSYRLIGTRLAGLTGWGTAMSAVYSHGQSAKRRRVKRLDDLKERFLILVTDENLRTRCR